MESAAGGKESSPSGVADIGQGVGDAHKECENVCLS
jgi:hypothetical protein